MLLLFLIYLVRIVMPQISRSALVPYSAEKMYNLVNDVNSYPQFLPGCVGSHVLNYVNNEMTASVDVARAGISETFVTHNILQDNKSIQIQLVKGPFRKLIGNWLFTPLNENACKVELYLDFEFTNKLIELAFGRIFKELAGNMVQAFTQRAHEVYRG